MKKIIRKLLERIYKISANYMAQASGLQIEIFRAFFACSEKELERFDRAEKSAVELREGTNWMNNWDMILFTIAFAIMGTLLNTILLLLIPIIMLQRLANKIVRQIRKIKR